jgi:hypothetical protein
MWCDGAHERSGHDVQVVVVGWVLMAVSAQDREQARSNGKHVCVCVCVCVGGGGGARG